MSDAARIAAAAREWLDVPYHHQGRVRAGLDCVGLLVVVGKACGYFPDNYDFIHYGRNPTGLLDAMLDEHLERIPTPVPGCVVTIRWWRESHHVAIVGQQPDYWTLIHSHAGHGGVREHRVGRWHARRVTGCWKYRGAVL